MGKVQVVVDGMTGTGKTTLVNLLAERLNLKLMPEEFRDPYNLLDKYSKDHKWCFPMQLNFLMTRYLQYTVASEDACYILDRSIYSDPVYAKLYYEKGHLTEEQYEDYNLFFNRLVKSMEPPKCLIALTCSYEGIMERIRNRGREDELRLGEDYWSSLYTAYQAHLDRIYEEFDVNYVHIDSEKYDFSNNEEDAETIVGMAERALDF